MATKKNPHAELIADLDAMFADLAAGKRTARRDRVRCSTPAPAAMMVTTVFMQQLREEISLLKAAMKDGNLEVEIDRQPADWQFGSIGSQFPDLQRLRAEHTRLRKALGSRVREAMNSSEIRQKPDDFTGQSNDFITPPMKSW